MALSGAACVVWAFVFYRNVSDTPAGKTFERPARASALQVCSRRDVVALMLAQVPMVCCMGIIAWKLSGVGVLPGPLAYIAYALLAVLLLAGGLAPPRAHAIPPEAKYVGEKTCIKCHDVEAKHFSHTQHAKIFRLTPGATSAELWLEHRNLTGIDGLTFLNGVLYYNSVFFNNLYRIPVDAQGKAGVPVEIWMDAPVKGIDGMRVANGKIVQAENGSGKIHVLTLLDGDRAHVEVIKEGLSEPTGMEPGRGELWIANRGAGQILSIPLPK